MKGAFLFGGGGGPQTRTDALDRERTMLYTDSMDETSSMSDRHRRGPLATKACLTRTKPSRNKKRSHAKRISFASIRRASKSTRLSSGLASAANSTMRRSMNAKVPIAWPASPSLMNTSAPSCPAAKQSARTWPRCHRRYYRTWSNGWIWPLTTFFGGSGKGRTRAIPALNRASGMTP